MNSNTAIKKNGIKVVRISLIIVGVASLIIMALNTLFEANINTPFFFGAQNELAYTGALSESEVKGLLQMREEELLAHDVYTALNEYWNKNIFRSISQSELMHTSQVKRLLDEYGIADPATGIAGRYTNQDIQSLYNALVAQGKKSVLDAYIVGLSIEDLDISDLQSLQLETKNAEILRVYRNLENGSDNHVRSFKRQLSNAGGEYTPQYISEAEYNEIISSTSGYGNGSGMAGGRRMHGR